jgi:hypothetical protein
MTKARTWRWVYAGFAIVLAGVFVYFVANLSDYAPNQLGSAILCMLSWLILGPTWLIIHLVRRDIRGDEPAEPRGFEVKPPAAGTTRPAPGAEESP